MSRGARPARRAIAVLIAAGGLWTTAAQADYVVRDRAGKRVETVVERPGDAPLRRDAPGRRLGVAEHSPPGHVLRDARGRRVAAPAAASRDASGYAFGVVRDRAGRRIGTVERR